MIHTLIITEANETRNPPAGKTVSLSRAGHLDNVLLSVGAYEVEVKGTDLMSALSILGEQIAQEKTAAAEVGAPRSIPMPEVHDGL